MITFLPSYLKKITASFVFLAAIFFVQTSFAQVKFSVVCPDRKIGKNDLLQIQFKVEGASNVDNITPPSFNNFTIVSGPNQQRSVTNINGKISQSVSIGFSLQPVSTGKFKIGSATAVADGNNYKTNPIFIEVVAGSVVQQNNSNQNSSPLPNLNFDFPPAPVTHQFDDYILKPGENVAGKVKKNIFLKLEVDKKSCYVGEPVVATYKLYTRLPSQTTVTDAPSFNGFSVSDIDVTNNATLEKYEGRLYNVYTMRKVQLYPLQPGNITIDPVVADNKITFIKSQYANSQRSDPFFDMFDNMGQAALPPEAQIDQNVTLKSTSVVINVKPLPSENKPADFRGAVGDFTITSSLEKDNITTDDAGILKLTVSGKGNIQLINAPSITWPKGIDGYDPKVKDNVDKTQVPMQGSKVFSFPFTVSKAGKYTIDSISFSYFDPQTSSYKTLRTAPVQVDVKKGKGVPTNSLVKNSQQNSSDNFFTERTEVIAGIVFVIGIIFLILFLIIKKNRNKDDQEREIKVDDLKNEIPEATEEFKIPESPLTQAHEKLVQQDSKEFYHTLDASLKKYLSSKFKVPANELSRKRLTEELDKCNVSLNTSLMLTSLLDEIEMNLYAPPSNANELNNVFEKASGVVSLLDKQVC
ncbi:MAG TPA: BatD family protein [Hanamia sp.]|nr:BatD family protein [Hanamia sp.]